MEPIGPLEPSIDFAVLADAVQAAGGKLYILGGGWDTLFVQGVPARHHSLSIGVRLSVPWTWADREIELAVDLYDEDGSAVLPEGRMKHGVKVIRPPGLSEGSAIGLVRAFTFNNVPLPKEGGYTFLVSVDGEVRSRLPFRVRARRQPPPPD